MRKLERRGDPYFLTIDMFKIATKLIIIFNLLPLSCLGSDYVIPNWQRLNGGLRLQQFDAEDCNGNKIQFKIGFFTYLFPQKNKQHVTTINSCKKGINSGKLQIGQWRN